MKKRLDSLEALRALACLAVFTVHSGINIAGQAAVGVFFMLSGFTMSYSSYDRADVAELGAFDSLRSAIKRLSKLYALYLICSLPVLVLDLMSLLAAYSAADAVLFAKKIAASIFLVQSWVPNSEVALAFNGVAWYLSTILFLYFAFPFVLRKIKKAKGTKSLLAAAVVLFAVQFAMGFTAKPLESLLLRYGLIPADGKFAYWFTYIFPPFRLPDFAIGCCLGAVFLKDNNRECGKKALGFELMSILLLAASSLVYRRSGSLLSSEAFVYTQLFVPLSAALVYTFALGNGPSVKLLTNRFTLFFGSISSDFFLLHQNIIRFTVMFLSYFLAFSTIKLIVPVLCFVMTVAACLIWKKIQKAVKHPKKS